MVFRVSGMFCVGIFSPLDSFDHAECVSLSPGLWLIIFSHEFCLGNWEYDVSCILSRQDSSVDPISL